MNRRQNILRMSGLTCAVLLAGQLAATSATLVNRYSFNDAPGSTTVADSVGGGTWNGTLPNGGDFSATPGQLALSSASSQYVQLPAGILSNYTAVSVDMWATVGSLPANCFLWAFGNTVGGAGGNCIFVQPINGRLAISGLQPSWYGEENATGFGDLSGETIHLTCVIDPPSHTLKAYTNGVLAAANLGETVPLSNVSNLFNYIARSLYDGDSYIDLSVDEYRIWSGALNALEVAGCDAAGPNTVGSAANAGTVTNLVISVPLYQVPVGGHINATVNGRTTLDYAVEITSLCTWRSDNTSILTVTNGQITAVAQGSATITASYGTSSNSVTITVAPPASALVHRYSFSDSVGSFTAADSIGGTAWAGSLNGGTFTGTNLQLRINDVDYVTLPAGILSNYSAVTIDSWATFPNPLPNNCFFWCFGDTDTGGAGEHYIFAQPKDGRIAITGADPGWTGPEQGANGADNLSGRTNVHFTAVFNPVAGWLAVYVNGNLVGKNTSVTWQMSDVRSTLNYIAKSLYNGDSLCDVDIDEYRIFNGAVSSQGIAIADAAGPDAVPTGITNGPGNLLGFTIQAPATLEWLQTGSVKLLANYQNLSNFDLIGNSVFPPAGLTITSSDTNVLVYDSDSKLHAVGPGTATISVTYQGVTTLKTITVIRPTSTLAHRYSFSETSGSTVADSIGGATWNGTLPNGGTFGGGQLSLSSTDPAGPQYVDLPANILSGYQSMTLETWVTVVDSVWNSSLFCFGDTDAGGAGATYIFCNSDNGNGRVAISTNDPGYTAEQNVYSGFSWNGLTLHVTAVINPPAGYMALYTNGVLAGINNALTFQLSGIVNNYSYLNQSLYTGDAHFNAIFNEFRIYNGALAPDEVSLTQSLGPDVTIGPKLSAVLSGHNIVVSWPTNFSSSVWTLQSNPSVSGGTWNIVSTTPSVVGSNYQVSVPATGSSQFFRLSN